MTQTSKRPKATAGRRAPRKPAPHPEQVVRAFAGSPIRAAFWERASAALKRIVEEAEEEALIRAVSAPTDAGALARAISETLPTDRASSELDPLASLIARGAEQKLELLKQAGGGLSASDVARLLHISRQAVDKRRREGKLLAVPRGSDY
jgi:DNA-directed RNA polymerase specialized sigma24 family protein